VKLLINLGKTGEGAEDCNSNSVEDSRANYFHLRTNVKTLVALVEHFFNGVE